MPFIYYRKIDRQIVGNSGYPVNQVHDGDTFRDFTEEDGILSDVIPNFGGVLADYGYLQLTDAEMAQCYASASYEIQFDAQGDPTGVITYVWAQLTCPATTTVGQQVPISASVEGGDSIEAILYIDGIEQARGPMPATWQVVFETPGTYLIEVDAGRHGRVSREVVVS